MHIWSVKPLVLVETTPFVDDSRSWNAPFHLFSHFHTNMDHRDHGKVLGAGSNVKVVDEMIVVFCKIGYIEATHTYRPYMESLSSVWCLLS